MSGHPADAAPATEWSPVRRLAGLTLASGPVPPHTRFRGHEHEGVHLCCVTRGAFIEAESGGSVHVAAGTVRLSSSARHDLDFAPDGAGCVVLHLDAGAAAALGALPSRPRFLTDDWLRGLIAQLGSAAGRGGRGGDLELDGIVTELLAQVSRRQGRPASGGPPSWLRLAREMVLDADPAACSLAEVACAVGVHRVHLARAFRDHYGEPIGRLGRRVRLQRALRLLDEGLPLARVAAEAGYADQSHLTRDVTRRFGVPPARLRRSEVTPVQDAAAAAPQIRTG